MVTCVSNSAVVGSRSQARSPRSTQPPFVGNSLRFDANGTLKGNPACLLLRAENRKANYVTASIPNRRCHQTDIGQRRLPMSEIPRPNKPLHFGPMRAVLRSSVRPTRCCPYASSGHLARRPLIQDATYAVGEFTTRTPSTAAASRNRGDRLIAAVASTLLDWTAAANASDASKFSP